jgi:hypothetical protein
MKPPANTPATAGRHATEIFAEAERFAWASAEELRTAFSTLVGLPEASILSAHGDECAVLADRLVHLLRSLRARSTAFPDAVLREPDERALRYVERVSETRETREARGLGEPPKGDESEGVQ